MPKKSKDVQTEASPRVKKGARKKSPVKSKRSRKPSAAKTVSAPKPTSPSDEQISIRAYFLAQKRAEQAIAGDHNSDWLEAKRQLLEEAGSRLHGAR